LVHPIHSHYVIIPSQTLGNHKGREGPRRSCAEHHELTERIIGLAIEMHRKTGPGLVESVYAARMCFELEQAGISLSHQVIIPILYQGIRIPLGFRADILVADTVILEIKAIPVFVPAHDTPKTWMPPAGLHPGRALRRHGEGLPPKRRSRRRSA
jgi:GxxExxY protein